MFVPISLVTLFAFYIWHGLAPPNVCAALQFRKWDIPLGNFGVFLLGQDWGGLLANLVFHVASK